MRQAGRWSNFAPPSLVLTTGLLIAIMFPAAMAAGPPAPRAAIRSAMCPADGLDLPRLAGGETASTADLKVEPAMSNGVFTGRRLIVQPRAGLPSQIALPAESFVAPPIGDVVVYGSHKSATGSEVRAISLQDGCHALLARPDHVVRSAVLDPSGKALYVHAVSAIDRRDMGVTRHDLSSGTRGVVVAPPSASDAIGPTFATELRWSVEGDALAVQSCGYSACRTRVLDVATGEVQAFDNPPHGQLVGLTAGTIYALEAGHSAPCSLLAIDRAGGPTTSVFNDALSASLVVDARGPLLRVESHAGVQDIRP